MREWIKRLLGRPTPAPKRYWVSDGRLNPADPLTPEEISEYEMVLNAAMNGPKEGVLFERDDDGVLRARMP